MTFDEALGEDDHADGLDPFGDDVAHHLSPLRVDADVGANGSIQYRSPERGQYTLGGVLRGQSGARVTIKVPGDLVGPPVARKLLSLT